MTRTATITSDGTSTFGWDWAGRLTTTDDGTTATSFGYDGDDLRTLVGGEAHVFDRSGWTGLPELVSDGTSGFVHGPSGVLSQRDTTAGYLLTDGQHSVR